MVELAGPVTESKLLSDSQVRVLVFPSDIRCVRGRCDLRRFARTACAFASRVLTRRVRR